MSSTKCVRHRGIITGVNPLRAQITTSGACTSCHAKGFCSLGQTKQKEITHLKEPVDWQPTLGQEVFIEMHTRLGFKALWYAMVLPALIMGALTTLCVLLNLPEWMLGLIVLLGIGIYYFVLYLLKDRIQNDFYFTVHHLEP
ncbi:MAG: SoxR reducing system RseC family protein [Bacteroidales bacterium]|nr:SoxR reducing system RseC family protein [Bacteroidales bacterium]MDD3521602.1 SoxR reducing system RseC family protein [Bacteroidales bacterium]MDD4030746.1 SoxR reducing system RseC family protein [Bacteroidales bacterium]MDD4435089.1 SoxR reducing system RseC family protein [Bacteroidales bacterium]MDD5733354.1 SoxR reducing system RseC family protein [Bacteroidales bacterium]